VFLKPPVVLWRLFLLYGVTDKSQLSFKVSNRSAVEHFSLLKKTIPNKSNHNEITRCRSVMKKLILSSIAFAALAANAVAADLPTQKAPPAVTPEPLWKGFYIGLNAGGTWSNNNTINSSTWLLFQPAGSADNYTAAILSGPKSSSSAGGFIGGGQIGYNWQARYAGYNFITGVEADMQGIAASNGNQNRWNFNPNAGLSAGHPYALSTNVQGNSNLSWLGTVRGRLGYIVMPTLVVYGTGGLAYGAYSSNTQLSQNWNDISGGGHNYFNYGASSSSTTMVGWTAGGGAEWMFMPNWSVKAEYLYYDLGNMSGSLVNNYYGLNASSGDNGSESITNYSKRISGNIVRAGVNYHFNLANVAPIIAKF
jgi:outer membrane immunogenic protein